MAKQLGFSLKGFLDSTRLLDDEDIAEIELFDRAYKESNGLIPNAAVPGILKTSKQNWYNIRAEYNFKKWNIFGKDWFSRKQLEEFYKLRRASGAQGPGRVSLSAVWNDAQEDDS